MSPARSRVAAREALSAGWAPLNSRVYLSLPGRAPDGGDLELVSRVEDHRVPGDRKDRADVSSLVVAAPRFSGDLSVAEGLPVIVRWGSRRGRHRRDTTLSEIQRNPVPLWLLSPVTSEVVEQRRRFVRVESSGRVVLALVQDGAPDASVSLLASPVAETPATDAFGAGPGAEADASEVPVELPLRLVDISEGGARMVLEDGGSPDWIRPGRQVRFRALLAGREIEQVAQIVPGRTALDHGTVVVAFLPPVLDAEHVRRHVMQTQIASRRQEDA